MTIEKTSIKNKSSSVETNRLSTKAIHKAHIGFFGCGMQGEKKVDHRILIMLNKTQLTLPVHQI